MWMLTVRIRRYDPERDGAPRWKTYQVEADPAGRVLDVLLSIKRADSSGLGPRPAG